MITNTLQYSIVAFVILSLLISIFSAETLQKSRKKHMIAACFVLGAAFVHAFMILLEIKP